MSYTIKEISTDKKMFMELLLLGDEQEEMIDKYLNRGRMFALYNEQQITVAIAVITIESKEVIELKNLAVAQPFQRKGYGRIMVEFICRHYQGQYSTLMVGTGDSEQTTSFYKSCGFCFSHIVKDFFTDNYDHPIFEEGKELRDMVYFCRQIGR